jgi:hypothetical protein
MKRETASKKAGEKLPASVRLSHSGHARSAISATRRKSSRLAPLAAWTAIPRMTVTT